MLVAALLCGLGGQALSAQSAAMPRRGLSIADAPAVQSIDLGFRRALPATHWKTGAIIGAVAGVIFANAMMGDESVAIPRRVGLSLVSAAAAAMPGALIGGLFPKR